MAVPPRRSRRRRRLYQPARPGVRSPTVSRERSHHLDASAPPKPNGGTPMRRLALPGTVLACLAAAALVAVSAPAKPTTMGGNPAGLQKDVDALVAAGAPGAILLVRA